MTTLQRQDRRIAHPPDVRDDPGLLGDGEVVDARDNPSVIERLARAEIDVQIATARRYPRSVKRFMDDAMTLATLTRDVAASCYYVKPQGKGKVTGPSVRLAEIVASCWGNLRTSAQILEDMGAFVKVQATCLDVERNNGITVQVVRRVTYADGRRYNDDMVGTTINAAISIGVRNAIFKVVPDALVDPLYKAAMKCVAGDVKTLAERRDKWIEYWGKKGVTEERVYRALGVSGREDVVLDHLAVFQGLANAIKDRESTLDEVFPSWKAVDAVRRPEGQTKSAHLAERLASTAEAAEPEFRPGTSGQIKAEPPDDEGRGHWPDEDGEPEGREPGQEG